MSYVYPFSTKATVGRTDQGKDFGGSGPIRAIGNAKIVKIGAPGWPGGQGVLYKLLDGPARGKYVYTYEGISPSVRPGQTVKAGQVIGSIIPGTPTGIETGWANSAGEPIAHGEYTEGKETVGGKAFASFLKKLKEGGGAALSRFEKEQIAQGKSPAEAKKEVEAENLGPGGLGLPFESTVEHLNPVDGVEALVQAFEAIEHALSNPESLLLNIGLLGGGAFLIYYGAALVLGVHKPVAGAAALATKGAEL